MPLPQVTWPKLKILATSLTLQARNRVSRRQVAGGDGPAVSLTSFGDRIARVHLTVESIGRGAVIPGRIVLWLGDGESRELPAALRRLQRRGLEVRFTEDLGPHTKYHPYCVEAADDGRTLVTADDDVLYPRWWLERLMAAVAQAPEDVWCYRSRQMVLTPDGRLAPYSEWQPNRSTEPSTTLFATGVSGVAYPPRAQRALRDAGTAFAGVCPRADDIWLHVTELRHGIPVHQVESEPLLFPTQLWTQRQRLSDENTVHGGNDAAIAATYSSEDLAVLAQAYRGSSSS